MKKYRSYIIITTLLALLALYYLIHERRGTLKIDTHYFALTDTSEITRIVIASGKRTVTLEQSGDNWVVNQKYNANIKLINGLMGLLTSMEINAPVPKSLRPVVLARFPHKSVHVTIETQTKTVKDFEICDIDSLHLGSFIKEPGSSDVYIARIPGFNNPLSAFFLPYMSIWRDNIVFRYKPWEIVNVKVEYPKDPQASFALDLSSSDRISLLDINNSNPVVLKKEDVVRFLLNFNSVPFHSMPYKKGLIDSLKKSIPYCKLSVKNINNQINEMYTYAIPTDKKSNQIDLFKMYAVLQNDTVAVFVKYVDVDPIMKKYREMLHR
jgi:hypothetical protein